MVSLSLGKHCFIQKNMHKILDIMQLLLAILPSVGIFTYEVREHQIEC